MYKCRSERTERKENTKNKTTETYALMCSEQPITQDLKCLIRSHWLVSIKMHYEKEKFCILNAFINTHVILSIWIIAILLRLFWIIYLLFFFFIFCSLCFYFGGEIKCNKRKGIVFRKGHHTCFFACKLSVKQSWLWPGKQQKTVRKG